MSEVFEVQHGIIFDTCAGGMCRCELMLILVKVAFCTMPVVPLRALPETVEIRPPFFWSLRSLHRYHQVSCIMYHVSYIRFWVSKKCSYLRTQKYTINNRDALRIFFCPQTRLSDSRRRVSRVVVAPSQREYQQARRTASSTRSDNTGSTQGAEDVRIVYSQI